MRERVVIADAAFEAVVGTVLVLGAVFGDIDSDDFPEPASTAVIAIFGVALWLLSVALAEVVKREAVTDRLLLVLAVGNAGFALLLAVWALAADGFTGVGEGVVWATAAGLMMLAAGQVAVLATQPRREGGR